MTDVHTWSVNIENGECINGTQRCFGTDLYECQDEQWFLIEANSPQCVPFDWIPIIVAAGIVGVGIGGTALYLHSKKARTKK